MNINNQNELTLNKTLSLVRKEIKRVMIKGNNYRIDFE